MLTEVFFRQKNKLYSLISPPKKKKKFYSRPCHCIYIYTHVCLYKFKNSFYSLFKNTKLYTIQYFVNFYINIYRILYQRAK